MSNHKAPLFPLPLEFCEKLLDCFVPAWRKDASNISYSNQWLEDLLTGQQRENRPKEVYYHYMERDRGLVSSVEISCAGAHLTHSFYGKDYEKYNSIIIKLNADRIPVAGPMTQKGSSSSVIWDLLHPRISGQQPNGNVWVCWIGTPEQINQWMEDLI